MYKYANYRIRKEKQLQYGKANYIAERRVFLFFWSKWFVCFKTNVTCAMYSTDRKEVVKWISNTTGKQYLDLLGDV